MNQHSKATALELVRRFWALYQARRWAEASTLLHPDAHCHWWASAERFEGASAIVHVNEVYPEGWTIHLLALNWLEGPDSTAASPERVSTQDRSAPSAQVFRIHSLVRVDQGAQSFYANSFFSISAGYIDAIDEYWADTQAPPAWRTAQTCPGRVLMAPDQRLGLSLQL